MGGFATGFLGALSDKAKQTADKHKADADAQKQQQADIYWGVIKNPDSSADQVQYAQQQLQKMYGSSGPLKEMFKRFGAFIGQAHPSGQAQGGGGGAAAPPASPQAGQGPIPTPPRADTMEGGGAGGAAAPTATGTIATPPFNPNAPSAIPKPPAAPQIAPPPTPGDPRFAEMAHRAAGLSTQEQQDIVNKEWDRRQKVLHEYKLEELKEAAAAKAANPTGRATAISPISMTEARKMAANGQIFTSASDQQPLTLDDYDDTMMLVPLQQNGRIVGYSPASQKQSHLTYGNQVIAVPSLNQMDANLMGKSLGPAQVGSTTRTTDPATGQTTVAVKTPNQPAAAAGKAPSAAPAAGGAAPSRPSKTKPTSSAAPPAPGAPGAPGAPSTPMPQGLPPLDPDGRIPASAGTPQVVEGANQLLNSEKDVKDLPSKTRELSASMARKYGWDENAFTPLERRQIGVASHFVDQLLENPNLAVMDEGFWDSLPMIGSTGDVAKEGFFGKLATKLSSKFTSPEEQDFLRDYRQLASVISGLGKLSRGGRVTESTVNRLLTDLPNPSNTSNSEDARKRLILVKEEINTALSNGTFEKITGKGPTQRKGAIAAPPKPGETSTPELSDAAKAYLKSRNAAPPGP